MDIVGRINTLLEVKVTQRVREEMVLLQRCREYTGKPIKDWSEVIGTILEDAKALPLIKATIALKKMDPKTHEMYYVFHYRTARIDHASCERYAPPEYKTMEPIKVDLDQISKINFSSVYVETNGKVSGSFWGDPSGQKKNNHSDLAFKKVFRGIEVIGAFSVAGINPIMKLTPVSELDSLEPDTSFEPMNDKQVEKLKWCIKFARDNNLPNPEGLACALMSRIQGMTPFGYNPDQPYWRDKALETMKTTRKSTIDYWFKHASMGLSFSRKVSSFPAKPLRDMSFLTVGEVDILDRLVDE